MKFKTIFCLGMFLLSSFSFSNEKSIEDCAKIEDPNLRLKCYAVFSFEFGTSRKERKFAIHGKGRKLLQASP